MSIEATLERIEQSQRELVRKLDKQTAEIACLRRFLDRPWTMQEVTEYTGLSWPTIKSFITDGLLNPVKRGGKWLFDPSEVIDFMTRRAS